MSNTTSVAQLDWYEGKDIYGIMPTFTAYTQRGRYNISHDAREPKAPWNTLRMAHPLMPPFDGWCDTIDAAKAACERDFVALKRADKWLDFMRDNDPPSAVL